MQDRRQQRCIQDCGEQWTAFPDNRAYSGSKELVEDIRRPLLEAADLQGCRVAEVRAGTGRIVNMLLDAGEAHVLTVEPSEATVALERDLQECASPVTVLQKTGDQIPANENLDLVFSIGVLHDIPETQPGVRAMYNALRPGGREGNQLLLFFLLPLRALTQRVRNILVSLFDLPLRLYMTLCRRFPLPRPGYLCNVLGRLNPAKRRLMIYDQLNPAYAKYSRRDEAMPLLQECRFHVIPVHHRHSYSWTVMGTKPDCAQEAA